MDTLTQNNFYQAIKWHLDGAERLTRWAFEDNGPSSRPATQQDLIRIERTLHNTMAKLDEFLAALVAYNDRQAAAIEGLVGDIAYQTEQIEALKNASGNPTPEQQAIMDNLTERNATMSDKLEALDAQTPPKPPVEPPPGPTEPPTEPAPTT